VYIFDDSFSSLDLATDARVRTALGPYTTGSAVLVVAQRVSTIMSADQILVLEDGRPVGLGTHRELLEHCATYVEIVESQATQGAA
jgi:ATP-binding cassette subfamily B protein